MLGRDKILSGQLFRRADENISVMKFGEKMLQSNFMRTVNNAVKKCDIITKNAAGEEIGKFSAHCFRRAGAQHRFITVQNAGNWMLLNGGEDGVQVTI